MSEFVKGENAEAPMVEATEEFFHPETGEKRAYKFVSKIYEI